MNKKQHVNGYQPLNSLDTVPPNIGSSVQLAITEEKEGCVMVEMSKTPEETKKGLECCAIVKTCYECPYGPIANAECMDNVDSDALAYIHQLEADNRKKDDQIWGLINSSDEAREEIRQLARKLDAVMRDLESVRGWQLCTKCKNYIGLEYSNIVCMECVNGSKWEWRGMEEESE